MLVMFITGFYRLSPRLQKLWGFKEAVSLN